MVRSLGRRGVRVWLARDRHTVATHSRFVEHVIEWPRGPDSERIESMVAAREQAGPGLWVLLPTADDTACFLSRNRDVLSEHFIVGADRWESVRIAQDKRRSHELAARNGIAFPRTWLPSSVREIETLDCEFPVILKPAVKESCNRLVQDKAWKATSRPQLISLYAAACELMPSSVVMIQELIPGDGQCQMSYGGVADRGRPVAEVVARRTRQYPVHFGQHSTYVESLDDPEVEDAARLLIHALRYTGLIEIEFKRDPRSGVLKLLDINARVWGWHTLGLDSHVDFSYVYWQLLQGQVVEPVRVPPGKTWMRFLTDVPAALREMQLRSLTPMRYARTLLRHHDSATFAIDDPLPGLLDGPLLARLRFTQRSL